MSEIRSIPQLENLLSSTIKDGEKIVNLDVSPLTAPGENFGSIMLRIDIHIKNENTQKERILYTVGKFIPENEKTLEVFTTQVTYRNEYKFYETIVPILDRLLKSKGISTGADFTAPFYGGRLNLDGSQLINSDAILLMENLKCAGYTSGKKREGLNFETSKLVLSALAKFHAAGIALKNQEPQTFEEKLKPYFFKYIPPNHMFDGAFNTFLNKMADHGFTSDEINVVYNLKNKSVEKSNISDTWGTMIHYDSWTGNFLIKHENDKPVKVVLVDFQICDYGSPLDDVMFYLFTSVPYDSFEESIDPLLEHYYNQLLDYLKKLDVDTQQFTKSSFQEEVKYAAGNYEYVHALWMLSPIMNEAMESVDVDSDILSNWSENHLQRVILLTKTCFKRGWLSTK